MRYSGLIKSGKILAFGKNGAVGAVPYGMTGIMLPTGAFVSGETIMTAAMTTGYTMTGSNMLVKVNDSMAGLTRTNMMAGTMGQANYQLVKETSEQVSNNVLEYGLSNPRLYGTNNNVGNIRENASYKDDKTVWDNITATQENWSNTQIPKLYTPILTYILRNLFFSRKARRVITCNKARTV